MEKLYALWATKPGKIVIVFAVIVVLGFAAKSAGLID